MSADRDTAAIASYDTPSGFVQRSTGPRRTEAGRCYVCNREIEHPSAFGDPTCGDAQCRETVAGWSQR
jgi:hypothetical protein